MNIKKIAKVVALAILAVVLLLLAVITVAVNYLRPEKLTPIEIGRASCRERV